MNKILELADAYAMATYKYCDPGSKQADEARVALVAEIERVERDTELLVMHQNTTLSWIEGHGKVCDITNTYYVAALKGLK